MDFINLLLSLALISTTLSESDFECFAKKIDICEPNLEKSYTKHRQKHDPSGFCIYIICNGKELEPVLYTKQSDDKNIAQIFVEKVQKEIEKIWSLEIKPMIMTKQDRLAFEQAIKCWICQDDFE